MYLKKSRVILFCTSSRTFWEDIHAIPWNVYCCHLFWQHAKCCTFGAGGGSRPWTPTGSAVVIDCTMYSKPHCPYNADVFVKTCSFIFLTYAMTLVLSATYKSSLEVSKSDNYGRRKHNFSFALYSAHHSIRCIVFVSVAIIGICRYRFLHWSQC